jgi:hypothetical protein
MTMRVPPPVVPPIASTARGGTGSAAQTGSAAGTPGAPGADKPEEPVEHHNHTSHRGHLMRAPPRDAKRQSVQGRKPPPRAPRPRGPRGPASADMAGDDNQIEHKEQEDHDDYDTRRMNPAFNKTMEGMERDSRDDSSGNEGARLERRFKIVKQGADLQRFRLGTALAPMSHPTMDKIAGELRSLVAGASTAAAGAGIQAKAFSAARGWLAAAGAGDARVTLATVRESLLKSTAPTGHPSLHTESARLWLPAFLLNLNKPRTPLQQQRAIETLDLMARATGRKRPGGSTG